jgi:hypothetical protein
LVLKEKSGPIKQYIDSGDILKVKMAKNSGFVALFKRR